MNAILMLAGLVLSTTFSAQADDIESKDFPAKQIKNLEVQNGNGDVKISAVQGDKATVGITKIEWAEVCKLVVELTGKTLLAKVEKPGELAGKRCKVKFDIAVPAATVVDINTGSGDVELSGLTAELNFRTGSGSVQGRNEFTKVAGRTGSGDIELADLVGPGELRTGSGDIKLAYKKIPAKGGLELMTGSGSSELTFPKDSKITTQFLAGSGTLKSEFEETPKATFKVSGRSGSGDMRIKKGTL